MSEFIETKFNSVPTGELKLNLINTQMVLIGGGRNDHLRHMDKGNNFHRFFVPEKMFEGMREQGYTVETYPDWETYAHWEDIETANEAELSSPEIDIEINGKDLKLTHFNTKLRMFADSPEATHIEVFSRGKCIAFSPVPELIRDLFDKEYPATYMSTLDLDPDSQKWLGQQAA